MSFAGGIYRGWEAWGNQGGEGFPDYILRNLTNSKQVKRPLVDLTMSGRKYDFAECG